MAKKDWKLKFDHEFMSNGNNTTNTEQIFWDSQSSEDEVDVGNKKRKVSAVTANISPINNFQNNGIPLVERDNIVEFVSPAESPVLSLRQLELYEFSPELSQKNTSISPVLKKRRERIKKKKAFKENQGSIKCQSPDLFEYDTTQSLESDSPVASAKSEPTSKSTIKIEPSFLTFSHGELCSQATIQIEPSLINSSFGNCSCQSSIQIEPSLVTTSFNECSTQATIKIEPFPSQLSSQVEPIDIQELYKEPLLYYQPTRRKKTFKKGSLAYQLDKILKLKRSRVNIWYHEIVNKINDTQTENNDSIITFKFKKTWNEYGNKLLQCELMNQKDSCGYVNEQSFDVIDTDKSIIVNLGSHTIINVEWEEDRIYKLFPPYTSARVMYQGQYIGYYSDASRILCYFSS